MIAVSVNGQRSTIESGTTLSGLLDSLKIDPRTVAVEINLDIIDKREFISRNLVEGDEIEIVRFVGGG